MAIPVTHAGPIPLLQRLSDEQPMQTREPVSLRTVDRSGLIASVAWEIQRLLATRRHSVVRNSALSVIDYGIADWSACSPDSQTDCTRLARDITQAIVAFEPRLLRPQTRVKTDKNHRFAWRVSISGLLFDGQCTIPVSFGVELGTEVTLRIENDEFA